MIEGSCMNYGRTEYRTEYRTSRSEFFYKYKNWQDKDAPSVILIVMPHSKGLKFF